MLKYLKSAHQALQSTAPQLIVTGNQSADMDSCCSALLTAYLSTQLDGRPCLPLIQIPRADLRLRKDIEYVFKSVGIDESWLIFLDDIKPTATTKLFLVDHNAATIPGEVTAVIDHHAVEDPNQDLSHCDPCKLVKSGSCISAVVNYFAPRAQSLFKDDPILPSLALAPIVIDTNNMTAKVEDEDVNAVKFLKEYVSPTVFSPLTNFAEIKAEKKNLDGLSGTDILRKDYKQWGTIGISSLPKRFDKLAKLGYLIADSMEEFALQRKLDIMIALANGTMGPHNVYVRELAIWGPEDFDVAKECPDLELELRGVGETNSGRKVRFYNQRNIKASRKQVAPGVREAFAKFHS